MQPAASSQQGVCVRGGRQHAASQPHLLTEHGALAGRLLLQRRRVRRLMRRPLPLPAAAAHWGGREERRASARLAWKGGHEGGVGQ